jgi:hypothetical protein
LAFLQSTNFLGLGLLTVHFIWHFTVRIFPFHEI